MSLHNIKDSAGEKNMITRTYLINNLACAHCGAKIEQALNKMDGVHQATLTFATKQLRVTAEDPDSLFEKIQEIAVKIEPKITLTLRDRNRRKPAPAKAAESQEHHHDNCCCGHEHEQEHHHHDEHCCGHEHDEHQHHHHDDCCCGHEHDEHQHHHHDDCCCGHEHEQEHHHHDEHCCDHDHEHEHHHHDEHCCGHDHEHEHHHHDEHCCDHEHKQEHHLTQKHKNHHALSSATRTYIVENLDCAHCGAKIERQINLLDGVEEAVLTFATKQLRVTGTNIDDLFGEIQKIATKIEPDVKLKVREKAVRKTAPEYEDIESSPSAQPSNAKDTSNRKELIAILSGAALFIIGSILEHFGMAAGSLILFIVAYVILGSEVLITAGKHLFQGQLFDENFLMGIATVGAFAIQQYPEAVGVMLFYRVGEFFEAKAVERSRSQIMEAADLRPDTVSLVTSDGVRTIDAQDAQIDDIILVRPGDRIPLDGVIAEGESRIDTSPVTGEPVPVGASVGDSVISGCINTSGLLKIRVERLLEDSMVTRILDSIENAAASKPKIDRFITRFARIYTPVVIALALFTAIVPSLITGNWNYWIYTALSFLVISCPCALVLSVPLAYFSGIGAGSKLGILFKGGASLEAIQNINTVIMDKTGTLTMGNFNVQKVIPAVKDFSEEQLLTYCAQCEMASSHPIAYSIVTAAKEKGLSMEHPANVEEFSGLGTKAVIDGHTFLCGNKKLMDKYHVSLENYTEKSFGTQVLAAKDGVFIGHLMISDTLKPDSRQAIKNLKKQGITPVMFTGDSLDSAADMAQKAGITEVQANLLPEDKLSQLQKTREKLGAVMFVGDGINDAPVLAGADVGAAMGSGADAAIEAADVVFMTSSLEAVPQSIRIAKMTNRIARQNIIFALVIKILVMILGLAGFASMWMAVFADTGVAIICVLNSIGVLYRKHK